MNLAVQLVQIVAVLVAAGFYGMSEWWLSTVTNFWRSGKRVLVLRVGRRGGKSSTLCLIAVVEALFGGHVIPKGDVGVVAIVAQHRDQGYERLRTIEAILRALHVKFRRRDDTIELLGRPIIFKVFSASISGVAGITCICILCDEVAKWRDSDTGVNPAREVFATLGPTMLTIKTCRMYVSSSALGMLDFHYELFELGDTPLQMVAAAPTWVANSTVTEAETHALESDARIWAREYLNVPQQAVLAALDADKVLRAFVPRTALGLLQARRVLVLDPSSGRADAWTWAVVGWNVPDRYQRRLDGSIRMAPWGDPLENPHAPTWPPFLSFDLIDGVEGAFWKSVTGDQIVDRLAMLAKSLDIRTVIGDQRESYMLESAFSKRGLRYVVQDWTQKSKPEAVARLRRLLAEESLSLVPHDGMQRQLLSFEERITPSGAFTYGARGSAHDDYAALTLTATMADLDGHLEKSPLRKTLPRGMGQNQVCPFN